MVVPVTSWAAKLEIAVTNAPLHSLVSAIAIGAAKVELVVPPSVSPHDATLSPKQRRMLAGANIIFWGGPEMEPGLEKVMSQFRVKSFSITDYRNELGLLPWQDDTMGLEDHEHDFDRGGVDPHFWLHPVYAARYVDAVTNELNSNFPEYKTIFDKNRMVLANRLADSYMQWRNILSRYQGKPILTAHDGFQYFEKAFDFSHLGAVSLNAEVTPSVRRVDQLRDLIDKSDVRCAFEEPQVSTRPLKSLIRGFKIEIAEVDPLGAKLDEGPDLYFEMMDNNVKAVYDCFDN